MPTGPMVRLTTVGDPIEAKIIAARLGSEGVIWELRGGVDGPYPMGPFHVYVAEPDLEVAHEVLTLTSDDDDDVDDPRRDRAPLALWLVVLVIVALAAFGIARVAMGSDACVDDATSGIRCTDQPQPTAP